MHAKRAIIVGLLMNLVTYFAGGVAFADDLAEVQRKIKDRDFKWAAKDHPNPEAKGLGLLQDGFMSPASQALEDHPILLGTAPTSLDWRNIGADNSLGVLPGNYVSAVKNQGGCGSCWAFATTAVAESTLQIAAGDPIDPLTGADAYNLSEQVMLNCSGAGSCNGGYVSSASSYVASTGLLREDPSGCYAYSYSNTICPNPISYPSCDQNRYRIDGWTGVSANVDAMKNALNSNGPLVTTFAVYNDFYRYYSSGVYEATSCDSAVNALVGYHAVAIVGYQDAVGTTPGYFIVKNSWGTSWGETAGGSVKGYFRIGYSQVSNCVGFGGSTLAYSKNSCIGTVTVAAPAAGEILKAGTSYPITWSAPGSVGQYVKLDLYQGGQLIRTISSSVPLANGSYQWTVDSNLQGSGYYATATSTTCSSASGRSGLFSIDPADTFGVSGIVTSSGDPSGVTVSFTRVSGTGVIPASVKAAGDGSWTASGFQQGTTYRATPGKTGCSFSPVYRDFTGASTALNFTAVESKIKDVLAPGSGTSWKAGGSYTIAWTYTGSPGSYVIIDLINSVTGAKSNLTSRAKIGSNGTGSYSWRIGKQQTAGTYKVKVTSATNGTSAASGDFSITK